MFHFPDIDVQEFLDKLGQKLIETSCTGRIERAFRCLGADLREFLTTLDGVHDVLQYQDQDGNIDHHAAFVCTTNSSTLELHFTTERPPVAYLLVGSLKAIAKTLYNTDSVVQIEQGDGDSKHFR